ncbi:MAG: ATP-binding cassette domain-containing protein [Pseudonocardia sp.]
MTKSLNEGPMQHRDFAVDSWYWHIYVQSGKFDNDKPLRDYTDDEWRLLLFSADEGGTSDRKKETVARYTTSARCPDCGGTRLAEASRTATVAGHTLPELTAVDLGALHALLPNCGDCNGRRYTDEVLGLLVDGKSISDVLDMMAAQASVFFSGRDIRRRLQAVVDVGLEYLTLDQPLSTLSGGECQRLKLAGRLHEEGNIYVLDEPTTGLHMSDCGQLLELVDGGSSVVVIEHNLDVGAHADWVIDLGPEGGDAGGMVVFEGPPAELVSAPGSFTGDYLARYAAAVAAG